MTVRKYGQPPYRAALLHGGPGAPGYMAPVARELSRQGIGVLEPLQTARDLEGQVRELAAQLRACGDGPCAVAGSSWGAVLALFLAAREPGLVSRLVLIGSAAFDAAGSRRTEATRLARLEPAGRRQYAEIQAALASAPAKQAEGLLRALVELLFTADVCDPLTTNLEIAECQAGVNRKVWRDFVALRDEPGRLQREFSRIRIPVLAVHGEYDPHPFVPIRDFLSTCLPHACFCLLPRCGHYPWIERGARAAFFKILRRELGN